MTLTAMMPSLRRTLPDPLNVDAWPECSRATTTDVVVAGVSLVRLVEICDTPCVHSGDAVIPGTQGKRCPNREASVVVVRVIAVVKNCDAARVVLIDGCLDTVDPLWCEIRLIGRVSTTRSAPAVVLCGEANAASGARQSAVALPEDVHEGDLLAVPCPGAIALREVRVPPHDSASALDGAVPARAELAWLSRLS